MPGRAVVFAIILATCTAMGCARVKPYQREHLSKRSMTEDREVGEKRFGEHTTGAREGASGGSGEPGGGCGCN